LEASFLNGECGVLLGKRTIAGGLLVSAASITSSGVIEMNDKKFDGNWKEECLELREEIAALKAERDDYKQALNELGVTPEEARKGAERSRRLRELLRDAAEALAPYMRLVEGTSVKNHAAQVYERIEEVLK
jgi:SMC interacting uncharacterized protein involved in chromosome segregation